MKIVVRLLLATLAGLSLFIPANGVIAQTGTVTAVVTSDGTTCDVSVYLVRTGGTSWNLGFATFCFNYNTTAMGPGVEQAEGIFDAGTSAEYGDQVVSAFGSTGSQIDIELVGATGTPVPTVATLIGTVRYSVSNPAANHNVTFNTGDSPVFDKDGNLVTITFVSPDNGTLPIQLASFTAIPQQGNGAVQLKWSTASETNNYGFEVQKTLDSSNVYETIANSFIAGHGTSVEAHAYSFTDTDVKPGVWYYRLKQTDLDGAIHYSEKISASGLTGVKDRALPTAFALDQNYPNPFNPATTIDFALPKDARVTLQVYNVLGQQVATLVDEVRQAGYHSVQFNAGQLASGLYIYRIAAGDVTMVKKMMLTK